MNNRVYGVVGVGAKMSMWNADMNLSAKRNSEGVIFGSDKALKFAMKDLWQKQGEKVLAIKHRDENYNLLNLKDIYKMEFGTDLPAKKDKEGNVKVLKNILQCIDVVNFGVTFAVGDQNIGITGAVQVGQGLNKWEDAEVETIDILSPYVNSTKEEASMTSIGSKNVVNEAHYVYPFTVNPSNYNYLKEIIDGFNGYTKEDYLKLKENLLVCATALETNSKTGCENEFAIFVECKDDSKLYLANLDSYIDIDYLEDSNRLRKLDITKLQNYLEFKNADISKIEVYYNPYKLELVYNKETRNNFIVMNMFGDVL